MKRVKRVKRVRVVRAAKQKLQAKLGRGRKVVRRAASVRSELPPVEAWRDVNEWLSGLRDLEGRDRRAFVSSNWARLFGAAARPRSEKMAELRIGYELQKRGFEEHGVARLLGPKFRANYEAARTGDTSGFTPAMRDLVAIAQGERVMPSKSNGKSKPRKERGETITATMIRVLSRASVPSNDAIMKEVKAAFPKSAFDEKHLAWYKSRFRVGALTGMDGKKHVIAQAEQKRERKAEPKAKSAKGKGKKAVKKAVKKVARRKVAKKEGNGTAQASA